jgi:hypothetical protein
MTDELHRLVRALLAGELVLEPLHEEALRLLDEEEDDLDRTTIALLEEIRFTAPLLLEGHARGPQRERLHHQLTAAAQRFAATHA